MHDLENISSLVKPCNFPMQNHAVKLAVVLSLIWKEIDKLRVITSDWRNMNKTCRFG